MKIVILDAQGGGMGRQLVEGLKKALPNQPLIAVGTNALATAAMLRAVSRHTPIYAAGIFRDLF